MGFDYYVLGQFERAIKLYGDALVIARKVGDSRQEEIVLNRLGRAYRAQGQLQLAVESHEQGVTIARTLADARREGRQLAHLGSAYRDLGQIERSIDLYEQALSIASKVGDRREQGRQYARLGIACDCLGQPEQAMKLYKNALTIFRDIGDCRLEGAVLGYFGHACYALGQVGRAIHLYEQSLVFTRKVGHRREESRWLLELGKALLATGKLSEACQCCQKARELDVLATNYQATLALGIVSLHQRDPAGVNSFKNAIVRCRRVLAKAMSLYKPHYTLSAALVGQAICTSHWADKSQRPDLLAPALEEYRRALDITAAPGIVQDAIRDLELIQAAGADKKHPIEGLEPAFELLKNAEYEPDLPEDLPNILENFLEEDRE